MKTYYSIIYLSPLPQIGEKIGIGLICASPKEVFYHFSQEKFNCVASFLTENGK